MGALHGEVMKRAPMVEITDGAGNAVTYVTTSVSVAVTGARAIASDTVLPHPPHETAGVPCSYETHPPAANVARVCMFQPQLLNL